ALFKQLWSHVLEKAKANRIFHAYMAANALSHQPPLGFFRHFVLVKGGKHDKTLDLKLRGVVPIIDVARVYALSGGVETVNTRERLEAAAERKDLSQDAAADLRDALEYISAVRLGHQARQIRAGKSPDNFMSPRDLSHFERNHLKDAFSVASSIQSSLSQRYQLARFG
ncbi:MAG: putative nucleotidyltransferase substrate binding domain-containing protein, partial [Candidatus Competibacteraceae bacterium]|nr:putative nucleotidyltransferase substrate binding domain-containing protein [Candidatus Competibacteraceae bacterium]